MWAIFLLLTERDLLAIANFLVYRNQKTLMMPDAAEQTS